MKFNFKGSDMVRCEVLRTTKVNMTLVSKGSIVEVIGNTAKALLCGPSPALKVVEGHTPTPIVERDTEVIISTPDPVSEATVKTTTTASRPRKAPKKKPTFNIPEDDGV
jgi:hypothetical protein